MHQGKTRRYVLRGNETVEDTSAGLQAMQVVLREITHWLHGRFDANPDFTATLEPGPRIVLTPNMQALAGMIWKIELNLSETPGLIKSVVIHEGEGSFTKLAFNGTQLNIHIDESLFRTIK